MPTVTFPLAYLQRLTATPPQQLAQQAFDYGLDATLGNQTLEVEVTAERPDLLAAEGFTRAINIYNGLARTVPDQLIPSGRQVTVLPEVLPLRPHIAALVVRGADLQDGGLEVLVQFQEKVTQTFGRQRKKIAIGVYDLDQISGDLTYGAESLDQLTFVPLHSAQPMTARQILQTHPAGKLYAHTLKENHHAPVLRDATGTVLSMPPIINGAGAGEVTASTRNLLIDVTGILPQTVLETANILAHNFLDTGAEVQTVDIVTAEGTITTPSLARRAVPFSAKYLNEIMGTAIPKSSLGNVLSRMDLDVSGTDVVYVPTYRTDIFSQVDIAGDLLVALGIATLQAEPLAVKFHLGEADPLRQVMFKVGDLAQRMKLTEVKSYVLTDPDILDWFAAPYLQTGNAKSRTYSATRPTLQAGLLDILARNISAPKPINIYETGEVLRFSASEEIHESQCWGFASLDARASFTTAKAYMQTMLKALGVSYDLAVCDAPYYITGRAATVLVSGQPVGEFGEIHPQVLEHFSFPEPVCTGELNCTASLIQKSGARVE
ncbi:phenylalanine--tRNA ligase subunit beta [Nodosilinea sp. LEGE 06152]|uniref:phenylalanine--tRNA ligase subunit beta n=1 Tax=Nodosilinea sp. LEGE 06152 TaxID=2777966 RepID=UPI001882F92C|nr:phenylalanine--tRNA ligase subunit beta [Nodosilinea sp. LEGE 06152]MBE9158362.1 phenylalanine--tRNA ligase subunit beta [Nodosilinea sp. LEGE 06152]